MTKITLSEQQRHQLRFVLRRAIEDFFQSKGFLAVDAPSLVIAGGTEVHLDYFKSHWMNHSQQSFPMHLRSSPELHLKQALSQGLERIYHIGKSFRNGGELSEWHHPEFTLLEWYTTGISYEAFMDQTEELIRFCHQKLASQTPFDIPDLAQQWERRSVAEAFEEYCGIELIDQDPELATKAISIGSLSVRPTDDFETAFFKLLLDKIEPALAKSRAVFLYDYPASQAALASVENGKARRFELYFQGIELCNAFLELTDYHSNLERLAQSNQQRATIKKELVPEDPDFIEALQKGLPKSCGNALGFDRLLAVLLGQSSIDAVIPFRNCAPYKRFVPGYRPS